MISVIQIVMVIVSVRIVMIISSLNSWSTMSSLTWATPTLAWAVTWCPDSYLVSETEESASGKQLFRLYRSAII